MHLMCIIRGIKHATDKFITEAQGKYLPIMVKRKGKDEPSMVQLAVRPIQLVEFVFPEEAKDVVLNTILNPDWTGKKSLLPKTIHKYLFALRKMLGKDWKKIPKYKTDKFMPISKEGVAITGIGIKKDRTIKSKDVEIEGL